MFQVEIIVNETSAIEIVHYVVPENVPIDLQTKFIVCAIKLKAFQLIDELLKPLLIHEDIELIGDLYLDVTEALMALDRYEDALKLLVPLVKKTKNYSLAAVWLKYADCLAACEMHEQAVDAYNRVIEMAPFHTDVSIRFN